MPTSEINVVPFRDDLTRRARKVPKLESQAITLAGRRRRCNHVVARLIILRSRCKASQSAPSQASVAWSLASSHVEAIVVVTTMSFGPLVNGPLRDDRAGMRTPGLKIRTSLFAAATSGKRTSYHAAIYPIANQKAGSEYPATSAPDRRHAWPSSPVLRLRRRTTLDCALRPMRSGGRWRH